MKHLIFVINPGSTSTKLALFRDDRQVQDRSVKHAPPATSSIWDTFDARLLEIKHALGEMVDPLTLHAVVGRGGLIKSIPGGTYAINDRMLEDARANYQGEHASNLGCAFAHTIASDLNILSFVVDPIAVDEFEPVARYSGHPLIQRRALSHTLNLHAMARACSEKLKIKFSKSHFIVAHLGGGISIAPLAGGRIIDVNDASSDGPFSPDRTGGLPLQPFIKLCFSGKYTADEMKKMVMGKGGLIAYLGTNDLVEIERRIEHGDKEAREVVEAMCYQIAKEIAAMSSVLFGKVDGIVLTGGLSHSKLVQKDIKKRVQWIAPVHVFAGEHEMKALALGTLRVLHQQESAMIYE